VKLNNKTRHSTAGLRRMLYDLAQQANITTRGITVEVRQGTRNLHGICYPHSKKIVLWLLRDSKTKDIAFIWLHELTHTTKRNQRLYATGHGIRAQKQADAVAERITEYTKSDIKWRNGWRTWRFPACPTKVSAKRLLKETREKNPQCIWRIHKVTSDKEYPYRLQYKPRKEPK